MTSLSLARLIAILTPVLLLGGAIGSQYLGGLYPCEMCYWQRWPHLFAIAFALIAIGLRGRPGMSRAAVILAALAIGVSGGIGVFHAGVEYQWWEGLTACSTSSAGSGMSTLDAIMATPIVRCDVPQWTLWGISLAGFNAIFSLGGAMLALLLALRVKGA
jgi:disulfide bond formation protein DsbB